MDSPATVTAQAPPDRRKEQRPLIAMVGEGGGTGKGRTGCWSAWVMAPCYIVILKSGQIIVNGCHTQRGRVHVGETPQVVKKADILS